MTSAADCKLGNPWKGWLGAVLRLFQCHVAPLQPVPVRVWQPSPSARRPDARRCFTLIECLLALGIVMLILAAAAHMTWMSLGVRISAERRARAAIMVNNRLESVANFSYAQLLQAVETDTRINDAGVSSSTGLYRRATTLTPGDDWTGDGECDNYLVRVSITFRSAIRPNPFQTITASTYVMKRETLVPLWSKP